MQNRNLILPVAGRSSRFPNMMPKYLLEDPSGHFMLTKSIEGISPNSFDQIVIVALLEHEERYHFSEALVRDIVEEFDADPKACKVILLENSTNSQAETVALGIRNANISGSLLIKDCDNFFILDQSNYKDRNFLAVGNLHNEGEINAGNKSYVSIAESGVVQNIVEKHVIGNLFCAGAYYFSNVKNYISSYEKVKNIDDLYVSHVIYQSIIDGELFFTNEVKGYLDWGTKTEWKKYLRSFGAFFIDIDCCTFKNDLSAIENESLLYKNAQYISDIYNQGKIRIILMSSRLEKDRSKIESRLKKVGFEYSQLILDIPGGKRVFASEINSIESNPIAFSGDLCKQDFSAQLELIN